MSGAPSIALVSHVDVNLARFRRTLMQLLVEEGWQVSAVAPRGRYAAEVESLGVEWLEYPSSREAGLAGHWRARGALARLFSRHRFQVVHSFTHLPNLLCRVALPWRRRPLLVNAVTGLGSGFMRPGLKGIALRMALYQCYARSAFRCDAMVFQNEDDHTYFTWRGLTGRALTRVVPGSGVDLARFRPGLLTREERRRRRASLGVEEGHVAVVMAARLLFDKGIREAMLAARALAGTAPAVRFLVAGAPDPGNPCSLTEADMQAFASLGNVRFLGWQEEMEQLWNLADVAILPSYREGVPVSMQEALACGVPAVVTDVPGCREIAAPRQGETASEHALCVPAGQWQPLAGAIQLLAESPVLRASMGMAARRKAEEAFDARVLARKTMDVYAALLAGRVG